MKFALLIRVATVFIAAAMGGCDYLMATKGSPDGGGDSPVDNSGAGGELDGGRSDDDGLDAGQYVPPDFECFLTFEDQTELIEDDAGVMELIGEPQQTSILFIFDKSGSMSDRWGRLPKWDAASEALIGAVKTSDFLLEGKLRVGGILFPLPDGCLVATMSSGEQMSFAPTDEFLAAWEAATNDNQPEGGTPLGEAFRVADRLLVERCNEGDLDHLFKILVLTDGDPNCDETADAWTSFPERWRERGIKTYVLGLPGSQNAEEVLNSIAEAGGTEEYIAPVQELPDGGVVETDAGDLGDDIAEVVC